MNRKKDAGQDLVEFALLALPLFLLLFGILEFGVAVWSYNTIATAAREGARAALVFGIDDRETQARSAACSYANGVGIGVICDAEHIPFGLGEFSIVSGGLTRTLQTVDVTVNYRYRGITGLTQLLPSGGITMSATSSMLVE